MRLTLPLLLLALHVPALHAQQDSLPLALQSAEDSLTAGRVDAAIDLAQHYVWDHSRDPVGYVALADAYAAKMPGGRFRALDNYREARRLAPDWLEPPYRMAQMGLLLGGADGERILRENLATVLGRDPLYKNTWAEWLLVYRNAGGRAEMIRLLRPHAAQPVVRGWIAQLLIENEEYQEASALVDSSLMTSPSNAGWLALRAQSSLEAGDTTGGLAYYEQALTDAANDSTDVLWRQVIGIAAPSEIIAWRAGISSSEKGAWLRSFWARRQPDLFSPANRRIIEHFERLRYARKHFPLLHPFILYERSGVARSLNLEPSTGEREFHLRCEASLGPPNAGPVSADELARMSNGPFAQLTREEIDSLRAIPGVRQKYLRDPTALAYTIFAPLNMDLRSIDTVAARVGYNLATGLDDRGIMYLRFGPPDRMRYGGDNTTDPRCRTDEVERWRYPGIGEVRFAKPSAFSKGETNLTEMVFRPMNETQFAAMGQGLTRDESSTPAPLSFGVWVSQFRDLRDSTLTDLVVASTTGELAAMLVSTFGGDLGIHASPAGHVTIAASPGIYAMIANARVADTLGRQRLRVHLRSFAVGPQMSDLLLASPWQSEGLDRARMLSHLQRDLTFPSGAVVRTYCELYGLGSQDGIARYHIRYLVLRTGNPGRDIARTAWPDATTFDFDRQVVAAPTTPIIESLDVGPTQLTRGQYLMRVTVFDNVADMPVGQATIAFQVR